MIYWERLDPQILTQEILDELEASRLQGTGWESDAHKKAKNLLKRALFAAQRSRCAYCRRRIRDELGRVEIDHVLPKKATKNVRHADSNDDRKRRSTRGYPGFTFVGQNLVLACKRCNNRKGSYDSRADRSQPVPAAYPSRQVEYNWVHPYLHSYSLHIEILAGYLYLPVDGSPEGKAVIRACRLDKLGAIELRSAEEAVKGSLGLEDALTELWTQYALTNQQVADILVENFTQLDTDHVLRVVSAHRRDILGLAATMAEIGAMM